MEAEPAAPGAMSLGVFAKGSVTAVRHLSKEEFKLFQTNCSRLMRFSAEQSLFLIVDLNKNDYFRALSNYREGFIKGEIHAQQQLHEVFVDLNRILLNFLSATRMFLDHTESNLKTNRNDEKLQRFKSACSTQYDSIFSYRFLYKLRNFAQHCGFPAEGFVAGKHLPTPSSDKAEAIVEFGLRVDKESLLKKYDSWGKVKPELMLMDKRFEIDCHIQAFLHSLKSINNELIKADLPEVISAMNSLRGLMNEVQPLASTQPQGVPIVFDAMQAGVTPRRMKVRIHWFPLEVMNTISYILGK